MQKDFSTSLASTPYLLGAVTDTSMNQIDSYVAAETIKFGRPVRLNPASNATLERQVMLPTAGALTSIGVAIRTNSQNFGAQLAPDNTGDSNILVSTAIDSYTQGAMVPVMLFGRVALMVDAVAGTQTVGTAKLYYTPSTGLNTVSDAAVASSVAVGLVTKTPVIGQLVEVQIDKIITI